MEKILQAELGEGTGQQACGDFGLGLRNVGPVDGGIQGSVPRVDRRV